MREARAAAALRHANVASVFQFGASTEADRCFYAMELVEGETLEALVRREGPLKVELALDMPCGWRAHWSPRPRMGWSIAT